MDASVWKIIVERAILRTAEGAITWVTNDDRPAKTLGFSASIDETTTLSFWGYKTNFSYELCLTKETGGEPFIEKKRITTKKNSDGIRCKVLLDAVQRQMVYIPRQAAFDAVVEYLTDPLSGRTDEERELLTERWDKLESLGWDEDFFYYSQTREILRALMKLTADGTITWQVEVHADGEEEWSTEIGSMLSSVLSVKQGLGGMAGHETYQYCLYDSGDGTLSVSEEQDPDMEDVKPPLWSTMNKLHGTILKMNPKRDAEFDAIVRANIVQDILAALDSPSS